MKEEREERREVIVSSIQQQWVAAKIPKRPNPNPTVDIG